MSHLLRFAFLLWMGCAFGCGSNAIVRAEGPPLKPNPVSQHLYLLALGPKNAFTSSVEREGLWKALRGEDPSIKPLLGSLESIPMDYRIAYIFNHTTPDSPRAESHRWLPWAQRLNAAEQTRVAQAQTILLVKGALRRLPNAQETRLTLGALVYLAERYDGVIFDLLTLEAVSAKTLRQRLASPSALAPQIRFIRARQGVRKGLRTVGLPKYGYPDLFLASLKPKSDAHVLSKAADALLERRAFDKSLSVVPCPVSQFDYGCYEVVRALASKR